MIYVYCGHIVPTGFPSYFHTIDGMIVKQVLTAFSVVLKSKM